MVSGCLGENAVIHGVKASITTDSAMQAKALAKDATDGGTLRQSASHLPLVLMSEKGSSTDDVWRGIEVGAADVLEKPLSLLKLRNIWQHVVRKVICHRFPGPSHTTESAESQTSMSWVHVGTPLRVPLRLLCEPLPS